jgi:universal stress protein A
MSPTKILVPVDFSTTAEVALRYGRDLARTFGATLHVLHAVGDAVTFGAIPSPGLYTPEIGNVVVELEADARVRLHKLVEQQREGGLTVRESVVTALNPAQAIVTYATDHGIDLIVIGTHGRGAVAHFLLGSVTERVIRSAPCPVLTVRHTERDWQHGRSRAAAKRKPLRAVKPRARKRTVAS